MIINILKTFNLEFYHSFINLVFVGFIALFPVINPIGSAFIVSPYFRDLTQIEKKKAVTRITIYAFIICVVTLLVGHWILQLFGISIPVIQVAGGTMICKTGWEFMNNDKDSSRKIAIEKMPSISGYNQIAEKLFFPITFPITTGAGTISVLFTLGAHSTAGASNYFINTAAIILSVIALCALVYIFFLNTKTLIHLLGENGENIVNRISAFLIFCVGLQIGFTGLKALAIF